MFFGDHKLKIVDWGLQDVAVKVLTDQDVGEAQLKEFLREVTLPITILDYASMFHQVNMSK